MSRAKRAIHYDEQNDILYLGVQKGIEEEFVEIAPGINVELDDQGKVIGIEVLDASRIPKPIFKARPRQTVSA